MLGFPRTRETRDVFEAYRARLDRPGAGGARVVKDKTKGGIRRVELRQDGVATAPTRIVVWIRPFDDIDFVLEGRVLEDHVDSYRRLFETCFKSFSRIERKQALPGMGGGSALSEGEREIEALPAGWRHVRTDHYLILSNDFRGSPWRYSREKPNGRPSHRTSLNIHRGSRSGSLQSTMVNRPRGAKARESASMTRSCSARKARKRR